jgi:hypothetical protein
MEINSDLEIKYQSEVAVINSAFKVQLGSTICFNRLDPFCPIIVQSEHVTYLIIIQSHAKLNL